MSHNKHVSPPVLCTATTAAGHPCQAHAVRGSDPPLCSIHAGRTRQGARGAGAPPGNHNARTHGFYSTALDLSELADLVACADDLSLDDEIACARVLLRRLMEQLRHASSPLGQADSATLGAADRGAADRGAAERGAAEQARLAGLALQAARTVARLLRDKRALTGDAADGLQGAMSQILDELNSMWGVQL